MPLDGLPQRLPAHPGRVPSRYDGISMPGHQLRASALRALQRASVRLLTFEARRPAKVAARAERDAASIFAEGAVRRVARRARADAPKARARHFGLSRPTSFALRRASTRPHPRALRDTPRNSPSALDARCAAVRCLRPRRAPARALRPPRAGAFRGRSEGARCAPEQRQGPPGGCQGGMAADASPAARPQAVATQARADARPLWLPGSEAPAHLNGT